ncbi:endoribonuclease YbeY [Clostridia bacterium]|nr:endoribonuclease YbeY [Clostridia bacterium]
MNIELIGEEKYSWEGISSLEDFVHSIVLEALRVLSSPREAELSISFVSDEEIRELNKSYRNQDKITDVLSFPLVDYKKPGDFSLCLSKEKQYCHPKTGEILLGDIVISVKQAKRQAEEYGHSFKRELAFLIVHSVLHLCGYDHQTKDEEKQMEEMQESILSYLGILRSNANESGDFTF